jgi:hypothetical protein
MNRNPERMTIGDVIVFGADKVHSKIIEVFEWALNSTLDHDIQAIFISDKGPRDAVGIYNIHTRSLVISLPQILENCLNIILPDEDNGFALSSNLWVNIIWTFFHEFHHNAATKIKLVGRDVLDIPDEWWKDEEAIASSYAWEKTEEAIIKLEANAPPIDEIPWLGSRAMQYLVECTKTDPDWVRAIKDRLDFGVAWEGKSIKFKSLVEYFLYSTHTPSKYEKENPGAEMAMVVGEEQPGLFDQRILPGQQAELFGEKPGNVSSPTYERPAEPVVTNPQPVAKGGNDVYSGDGIHDHLPPEAYGCDAGDDYDDGLGYYEDHGNSLPDETEGNPYDAPAVETPARTFQKPIETGVRDIMLAFWNRLYDSLFAGHDVATTIVQLTEVEKALNMIIGTCIPRGKGEYDVDDVFKIGGIRGYYTPKAKVPMYDILIKWNGVNRRFKLIAQNPKKENSKMAVRASNGEKIAWLIEDVNGETKWWKVCENGTWRELDK